VLGWAGAGFTRDVEASRSMPGVWHGWDAWSAEGGRRGVPACVSAGRRERVGPYTRIVVSVAAPADGRLVFGGGVRRFTGLALRSGVGRDLGVLGWWCGSSYAGARRSRVGVGGVRLQRMYVSVVFHLGVRW